MEDFTRREFVKMGMASFLGIALALPAIHAFAKKANANKGFTRTDEPLNWDAFIEQIHLHAKKQLEPKWNQDEYVDRVAQVAQYLDVNDPYIQDLFGQYKNRNQNFPEFEVMHHERTFQISLIQFEKGEVISHHDHPGMTGVLLCATGQLEVQSYEIVRKKTEEDFFLIRKVDDALLETGNVSTLTEKTRNIHRVGVHSFAQVIDIFAPPYTGQRNATVKWFDVDPEPYQGKTDVFAAKTRLL